MKKIYILVLLLSIAMFNSCEKGGSGESPEASVVMSVTTRILFKNSKGENLLTTPTGIKFDNIKLYNVVGGKSQYVYNGLLDAPKGIRLIKDENGDQVLDLVMNSVKEDFPVTYISLSDTDTDTIKTEYLRAKGSVIAKRIWYNGVLKWGDGSNLRMTFVVDKIN